MVNMYGAGKAFNLRFAQNTFLPGRSLMNPRSSMGTIFGGRPMVQNITVQTTPGGFFGGLMGLGHGFMLGSMIMSGLRGLFGGFFGGGMGGFGMGGINPNMSMSYPSLGGLTGTTPLSTQNANGNDKQAKDLAKLNSMYGAKGFHIVPNDDGTFSATDKDCKNVAMNKTFEEMCEILGGEPQGDGGSGKVSVKAEDGPDGTSSANPKDKVDGNGTVDGKANPNGTSSANPKDKVDGNGTVDGKANPSGTSSANANRQPAGVAGGSGRTGVKVPSGWYKAAADNSDTVKSIDPKKIEQDAEKNKFSPAKEYVKNHVLKSKYPIYEFNDAQIDKVTEAIIKYNPSVFNKDGSFIKDANGSIALGKLDIPSMAWLEANGCGHKNAKIVSVRSQIEAAEAEREAKAYKETVKKGVYYQASSGKYYKYDAERHKYIQLADVTKVNDDGSWVDFEGKQHSKKDKI